MYHKQTRIMHHNGGAAVQGAVLRGRSMIHIGRDSSNDICLPAVSVSRLHARIESMIEGRLLIHDADSNNGTFLGRNERWIRVQTVRLGPEDRIRFGDHEVSWQDLSFAFSSSSPMGAGAASQAGATVASGTIISGRFDHKEALEKPRRNPHTGSIEEDQSS